MRRFITNVLILVGFFILVIITKYFILGGAKPVTLKNSQYYGAVASTLYKAHGDTYQPIEGKDYTISRTVYFDSNKWLVVYLSPIGTFSDPGIIVLEKKGALYQTVFGPSSDSFTNTELVGLPPDLARYLRGGTQ